MLTPLAVDAGNFGRQVETVRRVRAAVGTNVPVISMLFSPLSEAVSIAGIDRLCAHLQEDPATLEKLLGVMNRVRPFDGRTDDADQAGVDDHLLADETGEGTATRSGS